MCVCQKNEKRKMMQDIDKKERIRIRIRKKEFNESLDSFSNI